MTITWYQLQLYALAIFGLWIVPGPVWLALIARALSGGMAAAWPVALGAALGNLIWPGFAILGLSWVLSVHGDVLVALEWLAAGFFIIMGVALIVRPAPVLDPGNDITHPGFWISLSVGIFAVIANPKSLLFYLGFLPGFFEMRQITGVDAAAILAISALLPVLGNLGLALCLHRARRLLQSAETLRRLHVVSGMLLALVGIAIPLS